MFYTTKAVDSLPLMKTKYTYRACMHPDQRETHPSNAFYKLENQQREVCEKENNTNLVVDPRFVFLGYEVDELTLLTETGIGNELRARFAYQ